MGSERICVLYGNKLIKTHRKAFLFFLSLIALCLFPTHPLVAQASFEAVATEFALGTISALLMPLSTMWLGYQFSLPEPGLDQPVPKIASGVIATSYFSLVASWASLGVIVGASLWEESGNVLSCIGGAVAGTFLSIPIARHVVDDDSASDAEILTVFTIIAIGASLGGTAGFNATP